jgi:hypothetical protein
MEIVERTKENQIILSRCYWSFRDRGISDDIDFFIIMMKVSAGSIVPQIIYSHRCAVADIPVFGKTLLLGSGGPDFLEATTRVIFAARMYGI